MLNINKGNVVQIVIEEGHCLFMYSWNIEKGEIKNGKTMFKTRSWDIQ